MITTPVWQIVVCTRFSKPEHGTEFREILIRDFSAASTIDMSGLRSMGYASWWSCASLLIWKVNYSCTLSCSLSNRLEFAEKGWGYGPVLPAFRDDSD